MIASMATYSTYVMSGLMHTVKVGKANKTIAMSYAYTGLTSPEASSYVRIIGLTNVLLKFTGAEPMFVGTSVRTISFYNKYTGVTLPEASSFTRQLVLAYTPFSPKRLSGVMPVQVISSNTRVQFKNTTGIELPPVSGFSVGSRYISRVPPQSACVGLNTVRIGSISAKFTDVWKYTGMRIGVIGVARLRLYNWQSTIVTQSQAAIQTLIQFWS